MPNGEYSLSDTCKQYIAGILKYVPEFTAVTNQWVNSYKRLVPGFEAPVYISWAQRNRSNLVRIPMYKPGKENATRIEVPQPRSGMQPLPGLLGHAGRRLARHRRKSGVPAADGDGPVPPHPARNATNGHRNRCRAASSRPSPGEKSDLVREALGEHVFREFIANKHLEWDHYRTHVTDYEINNFLPLL